MDRICPNCKKPNLNASLVCAFCGSPMGDAAPAEALRPRENVLALCRRCGKPIDPETLTCPYCDAPAPRACELPTPEPEPDPYAAYPYGGPYENPYGDPYANPYDDPYANPYAAPYAPPEPLRPTPPQDPGPMVIPPVNIVDANPAAPTLAPPVNITTAPRRAKPAGKNKKPLLIAGIAAAVVIAGVLITLFALGVFKGKDDETDPAVPPVIVDPVSDGSTENEPGTEEAAPAPTPTWQAADGSYAPADDDDVYAALFGDYLKLLRQARQTADDDERLALEAKAEAKLLSAGLVLPQTSADRAYAISRIAPGTRPPAAGNWELRLNSAVVSDSLLSNEERRALETRWKAARNGGRFDPVGYLQGVGHAVLEQVTVPVAAAPQSLDWFSENSDADRAIIMNCVDPLLGYDCYGELTPLLAESWSVSPDGRTYTFRLREDVNWQTADGKVFAELTAEDFVAGFRRLLDRSGKARLFYGVVEGVTTYCEKGTDFDKVGFRATDKHTLTVTLEAPDYTFPHLLTYTALPFCGDFAAKKGADFGAADPTSQVYCGPFLPIAVTEEKAVLVKNDGYYNADRTTLAQITLAFNPSESWNEQYEKTLNGTYDETVLNVAAGLYDRAKEEGVAANYAYRPASSITSFYWSFNLNRRAFTAPDGSPVSGKSEAEKIGTARALANPDFRLAVFLAADRAACNAVSFGQESTANTLRNIINAPDAQTLAAAVSVDGHSFAVGTTYGEMVAAFCKDMGLNIRPENGQDGWRDPDAAVQRLEAAKAALGDSVSFPIRLEVLYADDDSTLNQANALKESVESVLGAENVTIEPVAVSRDVYHALGYYAETGAALGKDLSFGVGWSSDYNDPASFLLALGGSKYSEMNKYFGLY